jgi:2-dehydropantoate 2-reductase
MRILVVGAGAIGGYFGGRMLQAGRDVTFLVRPRRAAELASAGLVIKSPNGDVTLTAPPTVQADKLDKAFDLVLLSCKAFDLEDAIASFSPAVGPKTAILPLLNGMRHLDVLDQRFGSNAVLGGLCAIAVTLNERREIIQLTPMQSLGFGERDGKISERAQTISDAMSTCMMRAAVGHILAAPGGKDFILGIIDECSAVASAEGHSPTGPFFERTRGMLTAEGSQLTASMFRDIKAGARVEADHIIGDLIARGEAAKVPVPKLRIAYTHLKTYENQRG